MSFFDRNNPQHQQLANAYQNGTYNQLAPQQVLNHYQDFMQNASPQEVQQVHQEYFNQMPQTERAGLFSGLMNALTDRGVDPRQMGVNNTNPGQASPGDLGNLFNLAQNSGLLNGLFGGNQQPQQPSGGLGGMLGGLFGNNRPQSPSPQDNTSAPQNQSPLAGIMNNPMARAAVGGLISYAASRALGGFMGGGNQQPNQGNVVPPQNQPNDNQTMW